MRQWVTDRWPENARIDLERDIGAIKQEIRRVNRQLAAEAEAASA